MMHGWSVSSAPRQEDAEDGFSTIEFQVRPRRDAHVIVGRAEGEDQLGYVDVSGADAVEAAADLAGLAHVVPRTLVHLIIRDERRSAGERLRWLRLMTRLYMDPLDAMFWDDDASTTVEMILNREDDVELRLEAATSVL